MVAKGPFTEFLSKSISESAAGTYTEVEITTPCSKTENMAMLISRIVVTNDSNLDTPAQDDQILAHLANSSQSAILPESNSNCVASGYLETGFVTSGTDRITNLLFERVFNPPILYAKGTIYGAIKAIGQADAHTVSIRIHYTLDKVDKNDFIDALTD